MPKLASLIVDLQVQHAQLKKGLDDATRKLDDFGKSAKKIGDLLGNVFSLAVVKAGLDKFGGFVRDGALALAEEEKSAGRLTAAFAALGYDAKKVAPYFNDLAEALEDETLVAGETVRQVEQLLVQFGVAPRDIEKTTRALLDYSAATGKDAVGAAQQLVTSVSAGKDEIRKMGISIQATGDFTKDLDAATEQLAGHFGGSAAGATQNLAGQLGHLQKAQEDLGKAFASFFVESDTGKAVIKALTEAMDGMTYALSKEGREQAASVQRTEQLTKLRDQLATAEKRVARERGRQGTWMASAGAMEDAKRESDGILQKIKLLEDQKKKADDATEAEAVRARDAEAAAQAGASAQAKAIQNEERRKKAIEAAAAAAKKAAEEQEQAFKRLASEAERWGEAQTKAAAQFERTKAGVGVDLGERRRAMAAAGSTGGPDTRGFGSFDAALSAFERGLIEEAALRERAAMAEVDGNLELQGSLELLADQQKATAENAGKAADAFVSLREASAEAERAMREQAKAAFDAMVSKAIGPVGGLIQAGQQGATAGAIFGPQGAALGAAAGVALELLTQSEQFQKLMEMVGNVIQVVADALGKLLEPLLPFFALIEPLATAVGAITGVLAGILAPAFELLWTVLKPVVMVVLKVTQIIGEFWNGLLGMLQSLLRALGGISIFGVKPLGFLNDWAKGLDSAKVDLQGVEDALAELDGATYDSVKAQQDQTDAQKELTGATDKATASLTNVPSGYKVALARFEAANGDALRGAGGASAPTPPPALGGGAAGGSGGIFSGGGAAGGGGGVGGGGPGGGVGRSQNLVQVFLDGDEVLHRLQVRQGAQAQRQAGRRFGLSPRLVGA